MTPSVDLWFEAWLGRHKRWNPGPGWNSYASDEDVFIPWLMAFDSEQVTEDEALDASRFLALEEPRYPEHHLHRLLSIIRASRTTRSGAVAVVRTAADVEADRRAALSAAVEAQWARLDEPSRESYREQVRAASPVLGRNPLWVEALAKQAHAEAVNPCLRLTVNGQAEGILDSLRRGSEKPDPSVRRPAMVVPSPAALNAEQERIAIRDAAASRASQLERLRAIDQARTLAS